METIDSFSTPYINDNFMINNSYCDTLTLKDVANDFIKNGEVYEQEAGKFLLEWIDDQDHIIVQTSGSTGVPKKIKVFKQHMINSAIATGDFFKVKEGTTALLCLPATYIAGKMMLVRAMVLGWKIDMVPPRVNPLDQVYKMYDFCAMTPFQLDNSLNRLHLIKKLIVGGGMVSENLKTLIQGIKTKIFETYGMTETVSHIAAKRLNPKKKDKNESNFFKALPNITLSEDERNCLIIKAPKLCHNVLVSNDVIELLTHKKFIWKGRYDNVINSGGIKLFPEEIESKLQLLIPHRFFVTGIDDYAFGEKLILIIEQDHSEQTYSILKKEISKLSSLDKYEIPKEMYFISKFIETDNGKIQRSQTLESILLDN